MKTSILFLLGALCLGCRIGDDLSATDIGVSEDAIPENDLHRQALKRAHRAYAGGDARKMVSQLGSVLADPNADDAATTNAIELIDAALVESKGRLDTGFELPVGTNWMRLMFQEADRDGSLGYNVMLNGGLADGFEIDEIRFVRERDGRVLASRSSQIGYFESGETKEGRYFYIHTNVSPFPISAGAYRIEWAYTDGSSGSSRVLVPTLRQPELPRLSEPARGAVLDTQPTIRWRPPAWVTDAPFGRVGLEVRISQESGPPERSQRWSTWSDDVALTEMKVGTELTGGDGYVAAVQYQWRFAYGELQLGSVGRSQRTFSVRAP